jgi:circadian clock protein KaiC
MKVERIGTGVRGLDSKIGGGFEAGSITLLEGGPGSGKTLFGLQFAYEGATSGENVLFISFDESPKDLISDMKAIGLNPDKYVDSGSLTFQFFSPPEFLQKSIDARVAKYNITRLVMDSVSSLLLYFKDEFTFRRFILDLIEKMKSFGVTTLITSGQDERTPDSLRMYSGEFLADTLINMMHDSSKGEYDRSMHIIKMRRTNHMRKLLPMKIDSKGLSIK